MTEEDCVGNFLLFTNGVLLTPGLAALGAFIGFYGAEYSLYSSLGFSASVFFGLVYLKRLRDFR